METVTEVTSGACGEGADTAPLCGLRVAARSAVFGVFCRRWGVPLINGSTLRLPRRMGQARALDMVLTGRAVGAVCAVCALAMGLANRVVDNGSA